MYALSTQYKEKHLDNETKYTEVWFKYENFLLSGCFSSICFLINNLFFKSAEEYSLLFFILALY